MNKQHRELARRLQEAGITVHEFEQRTSSFAVKCSLDGYTYTYFIGITPSDHRAMDNAFHDIKRALIAKKAANHAR